jgi:hypothetical protein
MLLLTIQRPSFGSNPKNLSLTIPNQKVYSYPPYSIHVFRGVGTTDGIWMVLLLGPVTSGSRIGTHNDVIIQDSCHSFCSYFIRYFILHTIPTIDNTIYPPPHDMSCSFIALVWCKRKWVYICVVLLICADICVYINID